VYPVTAATVIETRELWDELRTAVENLPVRVVLELSAIDGQEEFFEKLGSISPDILFLEVGKRNRDELEGIIRKARSLHAGPSVIALHLSADPGAILECMRAGAVEYLYPPFGAALEQALERISAERNRQSQTAARVGGKVLGFLSAKGGCGATTIACHVAAGLPRVKPNTRVLLADLDFDSGLIAFLLKSQSPYTVLDAARNVHRLDANYWRALVSNGVPGLEVITAPAPPVTQPPPGDAIRFVLNFSRGNYDYTLVDLGRNLSLSTLSALEQVDELFLITTLDVPALHQAKVLIEKLVQSGYGKQRIRLLLNRAPERFDVSVEELETMLGASVFATIPCHDATLNDSYTEGKLVDAATGLGQHFNRLAMRIAGVEPARKKKFSLFG